MKRDKQIFTRPIVVIDSGVGGLSVLHKLYNAFPYEKFIYLCKGNVVPLGNKSIKKIKKICLSFIYKAKKMRAKLLVVACNTMSLIGKHLFENSGLPVITVSPENFLLSELNKSVIQKTEQANSFFYSDKLLFCTEKSAKSPAISQLSNICSYKVIALKTLAKEIEKNALRLESLNLDSKILQIAGVDLKKIKRVYLGCTHYALIKNKFAAFFPDAEIVDGTENICFEVAKYSDYLSDIKQITFLGNGCKRAEKAFYKIYRL